MKLFWTIFHLACAIAYSAFAVRIWIGLPELEHTEKFVYSVACLVAAAWVLKDCISRFGPVRKQGTIP